MKRSRATRDKASARETSIEGLLCGMAFAAMVAYFIGRKGTPLTFSDGAYCAAVIAVFFGVLYVLGAVIVIASHAIWRFTLGAWRYGASDIRSGASEASSGGLDEGIALLRADVLSLRGNVDELLGYARLDGGRIAEMHKAFETAQTARAAR